MGKAVCLECGAIMDWDDVETYQECVGEYWGTPAYETYGKCPHCGACDEITDSEYYIVDETGAYVETIYDKEKALKSCKEWNEHDPDNTYIVLDNWDNEVTE